MGKSRGRIGIKFWNRKNYSGEATVYSVVETIIDEIKTDGQGNIE